MAVIQKQVRMVFDLNKCLGCQTCTSACKSVWTDRNQGQMYMYWNNVESQPGRGYPKNWETLGGGFVGCGTTVKSSVMPSINKDYGAPWEYGYEQAFGTTDAGPVPATADMIVPAPAPETPNNYSSNWDEDVGAYIPNAPPTPGHAYYFYLPRICNHCSSPACVASCTRKAIYKRQEDGIVLVDQNRCRGYRHCVKACPYKKVYWNPVEEQSQKCIFCYPRLEPQRVGETAEQYNARKGGNFCVTQCVGRIRWVGYYEPAKGPSHADNLAYNVNRLVDEFKVALRLHPEFGTSPNTFYIPPLSPPVNGGTTKRIPVSVLAKMFGDTCAQTQAQREARINQIFTLIESERTVAAAGGASALVDILTAYSEADRIQV